MTIPDVYLSLRFNFDLHYTSLHYLILKQRHYVAVYMYICIRGSTEMLYCCKCGFVTKMQLCRY